MGYSKIAQHEPLRVPSRWSEDERRFVTQLEEVLDDIYRRFGRLSLSDMNTDLQKVFAKEQQNVEALIETAKDHAAKIKALEDGTPEKLGYLRLGDGFSATDSGDVNARTGNFAEELTLAGRSVLSWGDVVVSGSQPDGSGILWVKPETVKSVGYSLTTGDERTQCWKDSTISFELTAGTEDTLEDGTFVYTLSIPVYETEGMNEGVSVTATLSKADLGTVAFPEYTIDQIDQWEQRILHLTVESSVNLLGTADPIQLSVTMTGVDTDGLYLQSGMKILLSVKVKDAEPQACTLYWIP